MNPKHSSTRPTDHAGATLDALLKKGVQADQRANKPATPTSVVRAQRDVIPNEPRRVSQPIPSLARITVRFTQEEAEFLEKARGVARSMGYKISDTTVFRIALNSLKQEQITPAAIELALAADARRRGNH